MTCRGALAVALAVPLHLVLTVAALAQRAEENVVRTAEDAFGTALGRESLGLYDEEQVRGLSPTAAGNLRIEGLYFDQRAGLNERLRRGLTIRVGPAALGYPFPAPSGIVDYGLRLPETSVTSLQAGGGSRGDAYGEVDLSIAAHGLRPGLQAGVGWQREVAPNGTETLSSSGALLQRWTPREGVSLTSFAGITESEDVAGPIYLPAGAFPPHRVRRYRFDGPDWARSRYTESNLGLIGRATMADGWTFNAGLFYSALSTRRGFTNLLTDLRPDGSARRVVIADANQSTASLSGEVRLGRTLYEGPRQHTVLLSLRGRSQASRYGGSDEVDLGPTVLGERATSPRPHFRFGPRTLDMVEQGLVGLGYDGRWPGVGELNLGLQRSDYRKTVQAPGLPAALGRETPWLLNAAVAATVTPRLALYAGYTRGLEETGEVPDFAANRLSLLPAIRTEQVDAGLRWTVAPDLRLVTGVFEVRRPYFAVDGDGAFRTLGDVHYRGGELSLAGDVAERLSVVAGALLLRPRVSGEAVRAGGAGPRPVGQPERLLTLNVDWRVPRVEGLSLDLGVAHAGQLPATTDNRVALPARTVLDLGARYRFHLSGTPVTLRVSLANLTDSFGWEVIGSGGYSAQPGRTLTAYLTVDR